ncbi:hypothetical protein Dda_4925 [Drechslerella dactyloides]|uniref:Fido domain-containing protein n=1 Tax=Drechslerella dactyloides TaxID=74499 RepID=A0AAD6NID7_DREDA|nr:hypothetical protein Dda_4925 [Drechslerella dactyloides]
MLSSAPTRPLWSIFDTPERRKNLDGGPFQYQTDGYRIPPWCAIHQSDLKTIPDTLGKVANALANAANSEAQDAFEKEFAKFIYSSNAMENAGLNQSDTWETVRELLAGASLTKDIDDTCIWLESRSQQPEIDISRRQVIQHVHAFIFLKKEAETRGHLSEAKLLECHKILMNGIPSDQGFMGYQGRYRQCEMVAGRPLKLRTGGVKQVLEADLVASKMSMWIANYNSALENTSDPVATASFLKIAFLQIHPFLDGNSRMSRLLFNTLVTRYYPHTIINFGETPRDRTKYLNTVRESRRRNAPGIFAFFALKLAAKSSLDRLNELYKSGPEEMALVKEESIEVMEKLRDC